MRRLTRDRVISVVEGKEIVGVYWEDTDVGSPTTRRKREADGSEILFECSPEMADKIIAIILACDHALDDDYDDHPEAVIDLTNMATSMVNDEDEEHLSDLRKMVADYPQSDREVQCIRHKCPRCDGELECVLFTEWGYKVWNGKEWVDEMPFSNAEFRCSQCNGSLDYEEVAAMGVV